MRQSKREHGDLYTWKLTIYVGSKAKGPKSVRKMMDAIQYVLVNHDPLARTMKFCVVNAVKKKRANGGVGV